MKRYYKLLNVRGLIPALGALFLLASCSSYQYAGYENDGIYSSSSTGEAYTANDYEESYEDALYYKNLFGEKAAQFEAVPQEGAIFTDVESYSSGQYDENMFGAEGVGYEPGRAAWGSDPDEISVNIYNNYPYYNPYYNPYIYPYYAGFYDPFWGPGHYRYGYYDPFRYGYGNPYAYHSRGWNIGFGFGWGGYYGYGNRYSPYHPYGGGFYGRNYYHKDVAYSASRRGYTDDFRARQSSVSNRASRIPGYSNTRNVRAAGTTANDGRTYQTRTTRVRSSSYPVGSDDSYRISTQRRGEPSSVRRSTPTRNTSTQTRTTRSTRSNNSSTQRSSSSNTRSSDNSSSSSGNTRSSRSSRGRGN